MSQIFPGNFAPPKISVTEIFDIQGINGPILNATGTITASFGSSLFLQRMYIPVAMNLSEIDLALGLSFNATNQGAGTLSQSLGIYSFVNSTSLSSVLSISGTSAWTTGTSTVGGSASLTQFQGGWSGNNLQGMTFASSKLSAGEYVVANLLNFAQGSSTWTAALYGQVGISSSSIAVVTGITSATLSVLSTGGLSAVSAITGISSYGSSFWALEISPAVTASGVSGFTMFLGTSSGSFATGVTATYISFSGTGTIKSSATNWSLIGNSANSNIISSVGSRAGSFFTGTTAVGAVTAVGAAALSSATFATTSALTFGYVGTGSTTGVTNNYGLQFVAGIMSTGALPATINLTSTAVTFQGGPLMQQPWFQLVGA